MEIRRIDKINLVDEVYQQLRSMITSGTWQERTKIESENKLAKQFSVSRVVVREALQKLRSERLIVTKQGIGTFVANPFNFNEVITDFNLTEETYAKFVAFRRAVEYTAIDFSAQNATEEDYDRMNEAVEEMRRNEISGDTARYDQADFNFHLALVQSAHNEYLTNAMQANQALIMQVFNALNKIPGGKQFGVTSHQEIVQLIRQKDVETLKKRLESCCAYNIVRISVFRSSKT